MNTTQGGAGQQMEKNVLKLMEAEKAVNEKVRKAQQDK